MPPFAVFLKFDISEIQDNEIMKKWDINDTPILWWKKRRYQNVKNCLTWKNILDFAERVIKGAKVIAKIELYLYFMVLNYHAKCHKKKCHRYVLKLPFGNCLGMDTLTDEQRMVEKHVFGRKTQYLATKCG